jgi:excisionase family DNA binding protein
VEAVITGELLTITQVARDLGVSRPTVASLIARGELKGYRSAIDRRARFVRADDLEKLKARAIVALKRPPAGCRSIGKRPRGSACKPTLGRFAGVCSGFYITTDTRKCCT